MREQVAVLCPNNGFSAGPLICPSVKLRRSLTTLPNRLEALGRPVLASDSSQQEMGVGRSQEGPPPPPHSGLPPHAQHSLLIRWRAGLLLSHVEAPRVCRPRLRKLRGSPDVSEKIKQEFCLHQCLPSCGIDLVGQDDLLL